MAEDPSASLQQFDMDLLTGILMHGSALLHFGKKYVTSINLSGGKRVFQFNNASPIGPRSTTFATLLGGKNLLKLYEAWYMRASYLKGIGEGLHGAKVSNTRAGCRWITHPIILFS